MEPAVSGGDGDGGGAAGKEAAARPMTAAEEALKRSTDCVYFLASPLTCKKGNDCEYRHSEGARVNPRDCWYWLNGNCLNPKCSFRHPPLDGLFGAPGTTSVAAPFTQSVATTQIPAHQAPAPHNLNKQIPALQAPASHNVNKQAAACYFFQKGQCLKGDRCPFMHGPLPTGIPAPQQVGKVSAAVVEPRQLSVPHQVGKISAAVTEPRQTDKGSWALEECTQKKTPKASVDKPIEVFPSSVKPVSRAEFLPSNGFALKRSSSLYQLDNELSRPLAIDIPVKVATAPSVPRSSQSQSLDARLHNGRDADEFLGESSPGFDVLADDAMEDTDYPHDEDDFGRESGEDGRKLYPTADHNYRHSDLERAANFEKDQYNGVDDYDRSGRVQNHYGREQRRPSSERIVDRRLIPERRVRRRESPEEMDGSDLRHRLLKQRRFNGSRSIVSPDRHGEPYRRSGCSIEEDRYRGHHSRTDQRNFPSESSISTRLQGRIALPVRSSPDRPIDMQAEREQARGKHKSRISPGRPINNPGRNDRVKRRSYEDFTADTANFRGQSIQSDDANPLDFAGPKSLAELKGVKVSLNSQEQSVRSKIIARLSPELRSLSSGKPIDLHESDVSLSFEGPKPLSDILKRKRESDSESGAISSDNGNHHKDVAFHSSATSDVLDWQSNRPPGAVEDNTTIPIMQESKVGTSEESEEEEGLIPETVDSVQSLVNDAVEMEEGLMMDTAENTVLAVSDQRTEESDYEAVEGADAKVEDDNLYHEEDEEFDEDEDEDDFARKVGVMFS